ERSSSSGVSLVTALPRVGEQPDHGRLKVRKALEPEPPAGGEVLHPADERLQGGAGVAAQLEDESLARRRLPPLGRRAAAPRLPRSRRPCLLGFHWLPSWFLAGRAKASPEGFPTSRRPFADPRGGDPERR